MPVTLALHAIVSIALVAAAVTLTALGHDAAPAWAAFGSYGAGAFVQQAAHG